VDYVCEKLNTSLKDGPVQYWIKPERPSGTSYVLLQMKNSSQDVLEELYKLFLFHGVPEYIRPDNGAEFTAKVVRTWLSQLGVKILFIEPGSPWENGYIESFNGKMRDEPLNREIFTTLKEAKLLIE